jgi:predicted Co/Zn/Cd cation transporter (cation efflux family)
MDIGWFRDLAIVILAVVFTGVLIIIAVLAFSLYRRIRTILDSGKSVARTVQQIVTLVQGIRQGIDSVSKLFKRKGGGDE